MHSIRSMVQGGKKERKKERKREKKVEVIVQHDRLIYLLSPTFCGSFENEVRLSRFCTSFELIAISLAGCPFWGQTTPKESFPGQRALKES
jgi:hypothetical protein